MLVQLFFAWRVKILTANNWIVALVVTCALAGGRTCTLRRSILTHPNLMPSPVGGLATAVAVGIVPRFTDFRKFKVVVIIWLAAECVGDIVITTSLVSHLVCSPFVMYQSLTCSQRKHKTGFKVTDNLVNRIITSRLPLPLAILSSLIVSDHSDCADGNDHIYLRYNRLDPLSL